MKLSENLDYIAILHLLFHFLSDFFLGGGYNFYFYRCSSYPSRAMWSCYVLTCPLVFHHTVVSLHSLFLCNLSNINKRESIEPQNGKKIVIKMTFFFRFEAVLFSLWPKKNICNNSQIVCYKKDCLIWLPRECPFTRTFRVNFMKKRATYQYIYTIS